MRLSHHPEYQPGPFSCRRHRDRRRINPTSAKCWSTIDSPKEVVVIEADTKGARLIIPWRAAKGQAIKVSYGNHLGLYRTENARIAWTQELGNSGKTIVGLYYETWNTNAA